MRGNTNMTEMIVITLLTLVYFIPALIAGQRQHRNGAPLFIINLVAGWTLIGWVCCLAWSFSDNVNKGE